MRVNALILVVSIAAALGVASRAEAEKVKTNQGTKLYSRPGEQAKVLLKIKSGQNMTVIGKEGRWLKVRVQGRTGYVPRSKVDMPDDDEIVRNTRRRPFVDGRGTKRGFGGEAGPDDRVGADATGDGAEPADKDEGDKPKAKAHKGGDDEGDKPKPKAHKGGDDEEEDTTKIVDDDKTEEPAADDRPMAHVSEKTKVLADRSGDSDSVFTARPSDVLYPIDHKGKWTMVENEEGDGGWIQTSRLDIDDGGGGGSRRKRELDIRARLGFMFISQGMRTTGSTLTGADQVPDNYNIGTSAVALAVGGGVLYPYGKDYVLGADLGLGYAKTLGGGIPYMTATSGISITTIDLRASAGYDLHKKNGMTLFGRLGYRYQGYLIDDVTDVTKNPGKFPSEVMQAPTLGVAIAVPQLTDKIGLKVALDAALVGVSISQTKGYEDGASPSAKAVFVGAVFTYRWKKDMDLQGTYDLNYESVDFGKPLPTSMRIHTGTDTARTDILHTLTFGIVKGF